MVRLLMPKAAVLAALRTQVARIDEMGVRESAPGMPVFTRWKRDTLVVLEHSFGALATQTDEFRHHKFYSPYNSARFYSESFARAQQFLESLVDEVEAYGEDPALEAEARAEQDAVDTVVGICRRFHRVAKQLRKRHDGRPTLDVADEYDVQDLLHGLLLVEFDDVRREDPGPKIAGQGTRIDFVIRPEQVGIEVKKTRASLSEAALGSEIAADILRYREHPSCSRLVFFVYDPEGRVSNPDGFEADITREHGGLDVRVVVCPKGD